MPPTIHLLVVEGVDRGKEITVPPEGIRVGRSSRNDVMLQDESMSRFHCRFYLKPGEGLWVTDLGSSNQTVVNGAQVLDVRLHVGDRVAIGGTVLRVVHDATDASGAPASALAATRAATPAPAGPTPGPGAPAPAPHVDLGLESTPAPVRPNRTRHLVWLALAMVLVAALAWLPKLHVSRALQNSIFHPGTPTPVKSAANLPVLDLTYEKVQATSSNIFRYFMQIEQGTLAVQIDDLSSQRHVRREKKLAPELMQDLAHTLETSGFFDLRPSYEGLAPGIYDTYRLSVTLGPRAHAVQVVNRVEPDTFATVRAAVEEFGMNELGLAALALEPEALVARANDAFLAGRKLSDEREVSPPNLSLAIQKFTECAWYLETIEPKPDFYAEALSRKSDCERELQSRFDNVWFLAERSIKLRDWKEAAKHLHRVCDMIPDRSDERNADAFKKLVDVERHLQPNQ